MTKYLLPFCLILLFTTSACQPETARKEVIVAPPPVAASPVPPALALPTAPPEHCARPNEYAAINTRTLQTLLTVGTLSCGERQRYTAFVTKFRPQLSTQAKILRRYFVRIYKKEGDFRLDQFVTRLANAYANVTKVGQSNEFCVETRRILEQALASPTPSLSSLSSNAEFIAIHRIGLCNK
jgi:hypothetical protein